MKFFLASQLAGHYSAAGETVLRRDLRYMSEPNVSPVEGLNDLLEAAVAEAKQEYRGLKISSKQVTGVSSRNVIVLLMYLILRKRGATDFGSDDLSLDQISSDETQLHHIFPFDFMMKDPKAKEYRDRNDLTLSQFREQVNDVANLTIISRTKNASIGNAAPWEYLSNETTGDIRKSHFIPERRDLWKTENFGKFLDERRRLMSKAMNALIQSLH